MKNIITAYHGTPFAGFSKFESSEKRTTENETNSIGFWFVDNKHIAAHFSVKHEKTYVNSDEVWPDGTPVRRVKEIAHVGGVYEVNLKLKNPMIFEANLDGFEERENRYYELKEKERILFHRMSFAIYEEKRIMMKEKEQLVSEINQLENGLIKDGFELFMQYRDRFCEYIGKRKGNCSWKERYILMNKEEANRDFVNDLKSKGHDGVIIKNTEYDSNKNGLSDQYIVFDSDNIEIMSYEPVRSIVSEEKMSTIMINSLENLYSLW